MYSREATQVTRVMCNNRIVTRKMVVKNNGHNTTERKDWKGLLPADDDWLLSEDAAAVLGMTKSTFADLVRPTNKDMGIRSMSRSAKGKLSRRGCGGLYSRHDCIKLRYIKLELGVSWRVAGKILIGMNNGIIPMVSLERACSSTNENRSSKNA